MSETVKRHQHRRYPHGNRAGREEALAHGRSVGVPEPQLDWTD